MKSNSVVQGDRDLEDDFPIKPKKKKLDNGSQSQSLPNGIGHLPDDDECHTANDHVVDETLDSGNGENGQLPNDENEGTDNGMENDGDVVLVSDANESFVDCGQHVEYDEVDEERGMSLASKHNEIRTLRSIIDGVKPQNRTKYNIWVQKANKFV